MSGRSACAYVASSGAVIRKSRICPSGEDGGEDYRHNDATEAHPTADPYEKLRTNKVNEHQEGTGPTAVVDPKRE